MLEEFRDSDCSHISAVLDLNNELERAWSWKMIHKIKLQRKKSISYGTLLAKYNF